MNLRWLALAVAVAAAPVAFGQAPNPVLQQMQRVEATLNRLSQEQVAVYQQFQIVQEMRRSEERLALQRMPIYRLSTLAPPLNVEDVQRDEDARVQRMNELQVEVDRLYARYRELEEQKRPLLDTLAALAQTPTTEADAGTGLAAIPLPTPVPPVTQSSPGFSGNFPGFTGANPGFTPQPVEPPPPSVRGR
ncbi:hypothetical protein GCM10028796_39120 [Ramlibacter monticola]|uniref:Uncharacterized protein n=1 Tax=Ramlibacter monticola TaxID=1926872 RepID=A0A936Z272_9BURK|nr:hypothetical protein [Ramlibacter monticola]MBL0393328.1 hypothetical protein [Ramlibacter monticola]